MYFYMMEVITFFSILAVVVSGYFVENHKEKLLKSEDSLNSIYSSISDTRHKLSVQNFLIKKNYVVNQKDMLILLNRGKTGEDDLDGYLRHLDDTYGNAKYCASHESNPGTCLNFKEGKYADDILGAAVWANLYGNLDRKLSKEAQNKLVKQFMQKANAPLEIEYQLSLLAGLDPSPSSVQARDAIVRESKELSSKYVEATLNKQEYEKKFNILFVLMISSIIWALLSISCNVIYRGCR